MTRIVLVTGAATGIGRAIAAAFAQHRDLVWITGRREQPLYDTAAALGETVTAVVCDHTDPEQVGNLLTRVPDRVDVVVNCAGGNTDFDRSSPEDLAEVAENWHANLDANLVSAVLTTEAFRGRLGRGGRIIHIGSIAADKGAGAYGAAKAGLASWNIELSAQLGPHGVTANVVAPGYVADTEFFRDKLTEESRTRLIDAADTRRAASPDDIASMVVFLAAAEARQITGQTFAVNGGEHATR